VNEAEKLAAADVIKYLERLIDAEQRVHDPEDEIKVIFDKIQAWKEKMGDQQQQSVQVAKKMKPKVPTHIWNARSLETKLDELKEEIGLAEDDVTIIMFTSLDSDHLTNLLVLPSELLKWFTMNFAGENRAEQDFLNSKVSVWLATTTLSADVIAAYEKLTSDKEQIMTVEWWSRMQYSRIGSILAEKLKDNDKLKAELR
jgi:hypothetical protein